MNIPDPLPLRNIVIPREITALPECSCGGVEWHTMTCSIRSLSAEQARAAVDAAIEREQAYVAALNAELHRRLA